MIVGSDGAILHTTDGGTTWIDQSIETEYDLTGVSLVDAFHGWAVGYRELFFTQPTVVLFGQTRQAESPTISMMLCLAMSTPAQR